MTYSKISELTAASALAGTEVLPVVQSSATVKVTPAQIKTYVDGTGVSNTSVITGEYQFTNGNELDYSASFTDGMSAATVTFTELPASTVEVHLMLQLQESDTTVSFQWKGSAGSSIQYAVMGKWADVGTNLLYLPIWARTAANAIYVNTVEADGLSNVYVIGYKTGA